MKFSELAEYLEKLEGTSSRTDMTRILADLLSKTSSDEARLVAYMTQGKLGPAYRSLDFGVADKMMIRALGDKAEGLFKKLGDLGKVAEELGEGKGNLNIKEVYEKLTEIAQTMGMGSQEKKMQLIRDMVGELDATSAKFAVKMVLGKLRTGFSDMTVLDALSWMIMGDKSLRAAIEQMYNVRADLGEIVEVIKREKKPEKLDPKIGTPVLMAKCEREVSAEAIWERLKPEMAVEYKLDGLRIQAHINKSMMTLFSRGLENVTSMYPDVCEGLVKQIKKNCIVEGEMIALGKEERFLPFQETMQRKRKYDIAEMAGKIPLKIFLFEILSLEGTSLINETNEVRRSVLEDLVDRGNVVKLMPRILAKKADDIEEFFKKAIADGTEGVVAKKLSSGYQAGARNFSWIKYKKSYDKSTLEDTIDTVVMGYDVGQGKRSGFGIGDFLIGVYDHHSDKYLTVAKIGTGLTDDEWRTMKSKCEMSSVKVKPENYEVMKMMSCDFWVSPKIVVEIKADEITKSTMHTSGLALRFPRLVSWRDKKPEDATHVDELKRLYTLQQKAR